MDEIVTATDLAHQPIYFHNKMQVDLAMGLFCQAVELFEGQVCFSIEKQLREERDEHFWEIQQHNHYCNYQNLCHVSELITAT